MRRVVMAAAILVLAAAPGRGERIKDIVEIKGARGNPLWRTGLVIGLNGTGDDSAVTRRAVANMLRKGDLKVTANDITSKSAATVMVTAYLPPFAEVGKTIDVTVSAISGASSLRGGMLLMTPLWAADGEVYATAVGAVTLGGFSAAGKAASVTKSHPTVGLVPGGATVVKAEIGTYVKAGHVTLQLLQEDVTTARRIAEAINKVYPGSCSGDKDNPGNVKAAIPKGLRRADVIRFLDRILALEVELDPPPAVIILNERTGTIVVGEMVGIATVAISHGSLSIITKEKDSVSQPLPFSKTGTTKKTHRTEVETVEKSGALHVVPTQVTVAELARALNAMGLTPTDLVAIFQALDKAGALRARLIVM